jgi:non-specific serine/threonine protein kinase/serine/threonine-protein kinase
VKRQIVTAAGDAERMAPEQPGSNADTEFSTHHLDASGAPVAEDIGPYHLIQLLGEGGMGEVWLAEQKQPVRRRVAVKLIKAGMDTREVVARFESERQALALMDHPAIAKVFDAGSTPEGRPYFVMEYVAGQPITSYCDRNKLTMRHRMELFIQVCEGVQHAHQKAIIHRDLKPSNILVTEVNGKPMPRIIDFGVAKATSQGLSAGTMYTQIGAVIGTLGYMSPEQADSAGQDIDTRSDVYSLGVVLYELLVGALPLDFGKMAYDEVLRHLREDDAPRPSTKVRTGQSAIDAKNRSVDPPTLSRQLRGDPDAIALKALEKDRKRRYTSPSELAADIGRYLRNEPVSAHAPSTAYRGRKYIRRHRVGVVIAGLAVVLLIGFAVAQAVELRRIRRERDRADRITTFMTDMFKVSDPSHSRGNDIKVREVLDNASTQIDSGLQNEPEVQARLMHTMGDVYGAIGLYPEEKHLLDRALSTDVRVLGPTNRETLRAMLSMARYYGIQGKFADEQKLLNQIFAVQQKAFGSRDPDTLLTIYNQGWTFDGMGNYPAAERLYRIAFEGQRRALGEDSEATLTTMDDLAATLDEEGKYTEAESLDRTAIESLNRVLGPDHPMALRAGANLAGILVDENHFPEAEALYRQVLKQQQRVLGPEHWATVATMNNLAQDLADEGKLSEAETIDRQVVALETKQFGPTHPSTLGAITNLANILILQARYSEARQWLEPAFETLRRALGPDHPETLSTQGDLALILEKENRLPEAESLYLEMLKAEKRVLAPDDPITANTKYGLASVMAKEGRADESIATLKDASAHGLPPSVTAGLAKDEDFASLRTRPDFIGLTAATPSASQPAAH